MRLEYIPIVFGVIFGLVAGLLLFDAVRPETNRPFRERRRRQRAELNVSGEAIAAFGLLCLAAALFGGESWRWTTVSVIAGTALLILGGILNRGYLREMLLFRGPARRTEEHEVPPVAHKDDDRKMRIR